MNLCPKMSEFSQFMGFGGDRGTIANGNKTLLRISSFSRKDLAFQGLLFKTLLRLIVHANNFDG